jgi:hypothetical protein
MRIRQSELKRTRKRRAERLKARAADPSLVPVVAAPVAKAPKPAPKAEKAVEATEVKEAKPKAPRAKKADAEVKAEEKTEA